MPQLLIAELEDELMANPRDHPKFGARHFVDGIISLLAS